MVESLGSAVYDLSADVGSLRENFREAHSIAEKALEGIAGVIGTGMVGVIASIAALGVAAITAGIIGLNAFLGWGEQLDALNRLFGMTNREAAIFETAMERVGLSAEQGIGQFSIFIRQLENSRNQSKQALSVYEDAVNQINAAHLEAVAELTEAWTQQQQDAADRVAEIWDAFTNDRREKENELAHDIAEIRNNLNERLAEMDRERRQELANFTRQELSIERDATKSREQIRRDAQKSLSQLEKDTGKALSQAHSARARGEILLEMREKRQAIEDAAKERLAEVATRKAERLAELTEQRKIAREEYEYKVAREKELTEKRIAEMERVSTKQIEAAEKVAQKQADAIQKGLDKQEALYLKRDEKENQRYERQLKSAEKALERAEIANPIEKAVKKLGLTEALDEFQKGKKTAFQFFSEVLAKFEQFPKGAERSAIAMELFGRGGAKFLEFLEAGSTGLATAEELVDKFNLAVDAQAVNDYGHAWNELGVVYKGLAIAIGKELFPVAQELLYKFADWAKTHGPELAQMLSRTTEVIVKLAPIVLALAEIVAAFFDVLLKGRQAQSDFWQSIRDTAAEIGSLITGLPDLGKNIVEGLIKGFWEKADEIKQALTDILNDGIEAAKRALGISSPSRVFERIGADAMRGFMRGYGNVPLNLTAPTLRAGLQLAGATTVNSPLTDNRQMQNYITLNTNDPNRVWRSLQPRMQFEAIRK